MMYVWKSVEMVAENVITWLLYYGISDHGLASLQVHKGTNGPSQGTNTRLI